MRALAALHASRRGVRVNKPPDDWAVILAQIRAITQPPKRGCSLRALADYCGVTHRAVRKWVAGIDIPARDRVEKIMEWLKIKQ